MEKRRISTVFLGFRTDFAYFLRKTAVFRGFWPRFEQSFYNLGHVCDQRNPKSTGFFFATIVAGIGVFSASTIGAANLK
jgi:hypothetical protein